LVHGERRTLHIYFLCRKTVMRFKRGDSRGKPLTTSSQVYETKSTCQEITAWFFPVYAPCVSWVLHFAADPDDGVLHHPARREHNLVPGDRPSPLPLDSCRPLSFDRLGDGC